MTFDPKLLQNYPLFQDSAGLFDSSSLLFAFFPSSLLFSLPSSLPPSLPPFLPSFLPLSLPSYLSLNACYSILYIWLRVFNQPFHLYHPWDLASHMGFPRVNLSRSPGFFRLLLALHSPDSMNCTGIHPVLSWVCTVKAVITVWNFLNDSQGLTMTAAKCWVGRVSQNNMRISIVQAVAEHKMLIFISHMS